MFQRLKNFFMHGLLASDEQMGKRLNPFDEQIKRTEEMEKNQKPVQLESEDRKALVFAALQVFTPVLVVLLVIGFLLVFLTARFM